MPMMAIVPNIHSPNRFIGRSIFTNSPRYTTIGRSIIDADAVHGFMGSNTFYLHDFHILRAKTLLVVITFVS